MGQKCSCICNKENDQTYNFYPESSFHENIDKQPTKQTMSNARDGYNANSVENTQNIQGMIEESHRSNHKMNDSEINFTKDTQEFLKQKELYIIKIQAYIRRHLARKRFKDQYIYFKQQTMTFKKDILKKYTSSNNVLTDIFKSKPFDKEKSENREYRSLLSENQKEKISEINNQVKKSQKEGNVYHEVLMTKSADMFTGYTDLNNKKNGYGVLVKKNGEVMEGNWVNDNLTGYGRVTQEDGGILEGKLIKSLYIIYIFYHYLYTLNDEMFLSLLRLF